MKHTNLKHTIIQIYFQKHPDNNFAIDGKDEGNYCKDNEVRRF